MKPEELIECGTLMALPVRTSAQEERMLKLQARAKKELPHDDPSTPDVDEGETEIARELRRKVECQQRAHNFLEGLKKELPEVLELVLHGVTAALLKR